MPSGDLAKRVVEEGVVLDHGDVKDILFKRIQKRYAIVPLVELHNDPIWYDPESEYKMSLGWIAAFVRDPGQSARNDVPIQFFTRRGEGDTAEVARGDLLLRVMSFAFARREVTS